MPFGYTVHALACILTEERLEERMLMQADDDGMLEQYVRLEGIKEPRALSWAEERALRRDLVDGARSVLSGQYVSLRWGPYCKLPPMYDKGGTIQYVHEVYPVARGWILMTTALHDLPLTRNLT